MLFHSGISGCTTEMEEGGRRRRRWWWRCWEWLVFQRKNKTKPIFMVPLIYHCQGSHQHVINATLLWSICSRPFRFAPRTFWCVRYRVALLWMSVVRIFWIWWIELNVLHNNTQQKTTRFTPLSHATVQVQVVSQLGVSSAFIGAFSPASPGVLSASPFGSCTAPACQPPPGRARARTSSTEIY